MERKDRDHTLLKPFWPRRWIIFRIFGKFITPNLPLSDSLEEVLKERSLLGSVSMALDLPRKTCKLRDVIIWLLRNLNGKNKKKILITSFVISVLHYIYFYQNKQLREYRVDWTWRIWMRIRLLFQTCIKNHWRSYRQRREDNIKIDVKSIYLALDIVPLLFFADSEMISSSIKGGESS